MSQDRLGPGPSRGRAEITKDVRERWRNRALAVRCTFCRVVPGHACITAQGKPTLPHAARVRAARDV